MMMMNNSATAPALCSINTLSFANLLQLALTAMFVIQQLFAIGTLKQSYWNTAIMKNTSFKAASIEYFLEMEFAE